ncbi:hypothetical protein PUN28_006832 [Cardiocondyla obscurior]|uniref:Uncharacterized protein n=1 Tax=Cardiocondyla obscurior TaxID=286306 RepID=A0AAW2G2X4_9HYME
MINASKFCQKWTSNTLLICPPNIEREIRDVEHINPERALVIASISDVSILKEAYKSICIHLKNEHRTNSECEHSYTN